VTPYEETLHDARWPLRLAAAFERRRRTEGEEERREAREELWVLLHFGVLRCLRAVAARSGGCEQTDLEDVASKKSLEILRQAECGKTDLSGKTAPDVVAFLTAVARHGLLDLRRAAARRPVVDPQGMPEGTLEESIPWPGVEPAADPGAAVEAGEFARGLRDCAEALPPRSLRIWFLRVFLDLSSREIAELPEIGLNSGHVDVLLHRIREAVRECMERKGLREGTPPPGTFALIWEMMGEVEGMQYAAAVDSAQRGGGGWRRHDPQDHDEDPDEH
jgi:RNA polymerase sigma-70 factor (ECF subfamily)